MRWIPKAVRSAIVTGFLAVGSAAACDVQPRATVPVDISGSLMVAPVQVNGIAGRFIVDTGAARTVVTPAAVARFGLELDEWTATTMRGVGGVERRRNAMPRSVTLGGVALRRRSLSGDSILRVAALPVGDGIDGLLGRDFLSVFDVDLDPARRIMALFTVEGCSGRFVPWPDGYEEIPMDPPLDGALLVPAVLDGVRLRALLDTGASRTVLSLSGMARMGLTVGGDAPEVISGVGPRRVTAWPHWFRGLRIGSDVTVAPMLLAAPIPLQPVSDLLVGLDWIQGRRLWISWSTRRLFVAKITP